MSEKPIISVDTDGLPSSWTKAQFCAVCSYIQRGKSPQYDDNARFPVLNQKCIRWDSIQYEHLKFIKETQWNSLDSHRFLQDGDILWNSTGTGTIGRACHYLGQRQFPRIVVDSHVTIVRASSHASSKYIFYYIMSPFVQQRIVDMQSGSTNQVELGKQAICDSEIPVAPQAEQARIVSRIEELFSDLDKGEENLRRAQAQLKRYRQSVLKAAVTGELTRAWREQNADKLDSGEALLKRILKARRAAWEKAEMEKLRAKGKPPMGDAWKARYVEPQGPNTEGLPELPEGWAWARMEQLGFVESGQTPAGIEEAVCPKGEFPWFKVSSMNTEGNEQYLVKSEWNIHREQANRLGLRIRPKGTIVFPKRGGAILTNKKRVLGRDAAYDLNLMGFVPVDFVGGYLLAYYHGLDLKTIYDGSNVPQINYYDVANLVVAIPPADEMALIPDLVDSLLSQIEVMEREAQNALAGSRALRQSILKSAFSGKLVPQDPNDEPAEELLRRIAAERAAQGDRPAKSAAPRAPRAPRKARKARTAAQPSASASDGPSTTMPGLAAARKAAGLSQAQLAERAGINQAYVSQMETGKRAITADLAAALARALGIEPSALTQA